MTLNSTGPISLGGSTAGQSIALELNLSATATISLNDTAVRDLLERTTAGSSVGFNNAYGKSSVVAATVLLVGGGGGGDVPRTAYAVSGGGGGGYINSTTMSLTGPYYVQVGAGGNGYVGPGGTTYISGYGIYSEAQGGGFGGNNAGAPGANGGGAGVSF
jgi:hypothetical protein